MLGSENIREFCTQNTPNSPIYNKPISGGCTIVNWLFVNKLTKTGLEPKHDIEPSIQILVAVIDIVIQYTQKDNMDTKMLEKIRQK